MSDAPPETPVPPSRADASTEVIRDPGAEPDPGPGAAGDPVAAVPAGDTPPAVPEARGERPRGAALRLALLVAGIVALGWLGSLSAVVVVIALIIMIFLHELGHYLTAKSAGMKVTEFFIGFGPRIWSYRRGETEYGIKSIPAGAYVRIIGMNNLDPVDPADESRAYRNKPYWRRMSVALAGSAMHFLIALVLLFVLLVGWGMPRADVWQVGAVSGLPDGGQSPAEVAGLTPGDRIVAIDGVPTPTFDDAVEVIRTRPGRSVVLTVERDGTTTERTVVLASRNHRGESVGYLGIGPEHPFVQESVPAAFVGSFTQFGRVVVLSGQALGAFFTPSNLTDYVNQLLNQESSDSASGAGTSVNDAENRMLSPVGAVRIASQAADAGVPELLNFLIAINVFIGIFNLVPLLPLDGGHVAIATYEKLRSRKGRPYHVDVAKWLPVTYAVVAVLVLLGVSALYLDLVRPIANPFGP